MNVQFVDIVETSSVTGAIGNATSGKSTLRMSEAIVDTKSPRMFIPHDASIFVDTTNAEVSAKNRRELTESGPPTTGVLKALVIRVVDRNNLGPDLSINQLKNDVFKDAVSLQSQTKTCSYGKLQIQPFVGKTPSNQNIKNGVVNVQIDYAMGSGEEGMDQAAMMAANEQLGDLNDSMFDLVLFCFPPGNNFVAFAYPHSKYSFYNNEYCGYSAAQMHEVGHNIGLAHSGQLEEGEYGDVSGVMGAAPTGDDQRMCYNPQKNYQLGWYEDKVKTINPLDGVGRREFILNGVSDYERNEDAIVVLRLEQSKLQTSMQVQQDFYIGFNRATGINADTPEDANKVTVVRKDSGVPEEYGQSTKIASLSPGMTHVIQNFNGEEGNVYIEFFGIKDGEAKIIIADSETPVAEGNCKKFTIELNTDNYPEDNSWTIARNDGWGEVVAASPKYTETGKKYVQEVCLPMGAEDRTYKFIILDGYKDGMCCSHGQGSYKGYDDKGELVFSGGESFEVQEHLMQVPKDSNHPEPTAPPTQAPTNAGSVGNCENFTVEIKTDNFPEDTSWEILDPSGETKFSRDTFSNKLTVYKTEVCLNYDINYEFVMLDSHGDGICCSQGSGHYKVINSKGEVVVDGIQGGFQKKEHTIELGSEFTDPDSDNSCVEFSVEVRTDNFPEDSSWSILDKSGNEKFSRDSFDKSSTVFSDKVCLDNDTEYNFIMMDSFSDGLCCNNGQGYYKVMDSSGNAVVNGIEGNFNQMEHPIIVGSVTEAPVKICEDRGDKFKWKPSSKSRYCKFWSKKKCNVVNHFTDLPIWHDCPVSCNR